MSSRPRISLEDRGKIGVRLKCNYKSATLILKRKKLNGSVSDLQIPGQTRKTTRKEDSIIVRKSKCNRFKTAPQVRAEVKNPVWY